MYSFTFVKNEKYIRHYTREWLLPGALTPLGARLIIASLQGLMVSSGQPGGYRRYIAKLLYGYQCKFCQGKGPSLKLPFSVVSQ